jgi:hypothetical protein
MAVITVIAAGEVRRVLSCGCRAVMAGKASAEHLRVVDRDRRHKGNRVVAVLTHVGCRDVIRIPARCIDTVMAGEAGARDIAVIEDRRYPGSGLVAVVALITGNYVVGRLAGCSDAIVTADAAPRDGPCTAPIAE